MPRNPKRDRRVADFSTPDYTGDCLLPLLQPTRQCLQPLLNARTAVCLMRTSRFILTCLLAEYAILDPELVKKYAGRTAAELRRSFAFFAQYGMRIHALSLPQNWNHSLVDAASGLSVLPSSLKALTLGMHRLERGKYMTMMRCVFDGSDGNPRVVDDQYLMETEPHLERRQKEFDDRYFANDEERDEFDRLLRPVNAGRRWHQRGKPWDVYQFLDTEGVFKHPIPPGALPHGLRFLQFSRYYNQPLQKGSIPDTVEVLQFGQESEQRLDVGFLPSSLIHLNLGDSKHPLLPGVLAAGLRRLKMGRMYNIPLQPGILPSQLEELSFGSMYKQPIPPGVIPPSVTHLRLGMCFDQPLEAGSIPEGVRYLSFAAGHFNQPLSPGVLPTSLRSIVLSERFDQPLVHGSIPEGVRHLNLGQGGDWYTSGAFNQPLLPGVLPTSLRELVISKKFNLPLQAGSLPDGLEVLAFPSYSEFQQPLQPGVIPASVRAIAIGEKYTQELSVGSIPSTVMWLRLPESYADKDLTSVLSASTSVVWGD